MNRYIYRNACELEVVYISFLFNFFLSQQTEMRCNFFIILLFFYACTYIFLWIRQHFWNLFHYSLVCTFINCTPIIWMWGGSNKKQRTMYPMTWTVPDQNYIFHESPVQLLIISALWRDSISSCGRTSAKTLMVQRLLQRNFCIFLL